MSQEKDSIFNISFVLGACSGVAATSLVTVATLAFVNPEPFQHIVESIQNGEGLELIQNTYDISE